MLLSGLTKTYRHPDSAERDLVIPPSSFSMRSVLKPISPSIRTLSTIRSVSDWTASLKGFVVIRTDHLDARRASQLQSTLPTRSWKGGLCSTQAQEGDALPPAHHLVYFQPDSSFDELGLDGSSTVSPIFSNAHVRNTILQHLIFVACGRVDLLNGVCARNW